jgi:hypothetical protein
MTAADNAAAQCCETSGTANIELFGYRADGAMRWYCADHRLGQFYADKREGLPSLERNE